VLSKNDIQTWRRNKLRLYIKMIMKIDFTEINGISVAEIISDNIEINNQQDALEIMMNCKFQGADRLIVQEKNLNPDFFELKSGIAGEILQKFSTYNAKLAIVGDFSKYSSKSLKDFIFESNKTGRINFMNSTKEAKERLVK